MAKRNNTSGRKSSSRRRFQPFCQHSLWRTDLPVSSAQGGKSLPPGRTLPQANSLHSIRP